MANFTQRPAGRGTGSTNVKRTTKSRKKKGNIFVRILKYFLPWKGDSVTEIVRKVVFAVALTAFIITGGQVLLDLGNEAIAIKQHEEIQQLKDEGSLNLEDEVIQQILDEVPEIVPDYMALYAQNSDFKGWITVGQEIDYEVMQSADNDYYLKHNLKKEETLSGAIFADYRNKFSADGLSGNTILYGHNMFSGTMFTKLSRYYNAALYPNEGYTGRLDYYKKNPVITFDTIYEKAQWKVFACVLFNTDSNYGEVYDYLDTIEFANADSFNNYVLDIMDRSVLWTDVDLTYGDSLLTMSTCYFPYGNSIETRCVVFARKVREGESAEVNVDAAMTNPNPLMFKYQYDQLGGSWQGRTWDTSKLLSYNQ